MEEDPENQELFQLLEDLEADQLVEVKFLDFKTKKNNKSFLQ